MRTLLIAFAVLSAVSTTSCFRKQHLTAQYAQSYDAAFAAQRAPARADAPESPVAGLDSQEAAIISDTYRASLAPKGEKPREEPILIVAPQNRERPQMPAPSVPK